jgi:uncharacterized protein with HEPN domain
MPLLWGLATGAVTGFKPSCFAKFCLCGRVAAAVICQPLNRFSRLGEASNNIQLTDPSFAAQHDNVPWQVMYAMINRVSHGCDNIDFKLFWKTISNDLPDLNKLVKSAST